MEEMTSSRDETEGSDIQKPFLSSGKFSKRDRSISVLACVLIVASGPIQFGFTLGYSSPTQAALTRDLNLSVSQYSLFGSLTNVGAMVGALACGHISEYMGRKWSLIIASIPNIIGWFLISFARDCSFLYMGRLLEGFGVGIISYVVPIYIAEIAPEDVRGALGSLNQLSVTVGILLSYLLGFLLNWRFLAAVGALPCLMLLPGLIFIPESPRWLAKVGLEEDFEASLQVLRGVDTDISREANEIKRSLIPSNGKTTIRLKDLKQRRYWLPLMIGIGLLVFQQLSGINAVIFYSIDIFETAGISSSTAVTVGLGAIQVIASVVALWFVDRSGRRVLLITSFSGMAFSYFLVVMSFFLKGFIPEDSKLYQNLGIVAVIGVLLMTIAFSLGAGPIPRLMMSEVLPADIKGLGGSASMLFSWSSTWAITMTAPLLLAWSSGGAFAIYGLMSGLALLFVVIWVPETKGRTLGEIHLSFQ